MRLRTPPSSLDLVRPGAVAVTVVRDRRIEVISGALRLPAVDLDPVLSSAGVGWEGILLEEHDSVTPRLVNAPEHFSSKHILRLNTGGPSRSDWRVDGQSRRTHDQPQAVSILPAGTRVSVMTHRTSGLVLEIDPLLLHQNAAPSVSGGLELPVKLTIPDRKCSRRSSNRTRAASETLFSRFCSMYSRTCARKPSSLNLSKMLLSRNLANFRCARFRGCCCGPILMACRNHAFAVGVVFTFFAADAQDILAASFHIGCIRRYGILPACAIRQQPRIRCVLLQSRQEFAAFHPGT